MNVFISFAKEDKNKVSRLEEIVRHGGGRVWQFVYDLHGARDWATEIQSKKDQCEVFLFVITNYSLQSEWCLRELQHAALCQKPIVTVVFTSDIDIPHPLNTIQYVLFDETPESGAKTVRALQDPHPISRDMIPPNWEKLGGGPMGVAATSHSQIPIPRIKRELTDMEKENFLNDAIAEIRAYFNQALSEFQNSDPGVKTQICDKANMGGFNCEVHVDGKLKKRCTIWNYNEYGMNGIAYFETNKHMTIYGKQQYNELAQVAELNGNPALEFTLGLRMFHQFGDCQVCMVDKAAKCLWKYFTKEFD